MGTMNCQSLIGAIARWVTDPTLSSSADGTVFSRADVVEMLDQRILDMWEEMKRRNPMRVVAVYTMSVVAAQDEYNLPAACSRCLFWRRLILGKTTEWRGIARINPAEESSEGEGISQTYVSDGTPWGVYEFGDGEVRKIKLVPLPSTSESNVLQLKYERRPVPLGFGTAAAGAASTITLASSPTVGSTSGLDDYYNGSEIEIVSGTGAGQVRRISDYVGSTRVATVDTAWDTTPTAASVYSLLPPFGMEARNAILYGAAANLVAADGTEDPGVLVQKMQYSQKVWLSTIYDGGPYAVDSHINDAVETMAGYPDGLEWQL